MDELYNALSKTQAEMESAKLNSKNPHYKSNYANLESCIEASRPYLTKNGLCVLQMISTQNDKTFLVTRLAHSSGQFIESSMEIKPARNDMQGLGAAITYARRYAYSSMICLSTGDDDDGEKDRKMREEEERKKQEEEKKPPVECLTSEQIEEIENYFDFKPELRNKVLEIAKVSSVQDIPRNWYARLIGFLKKEMDI